MAWVQHSELPPVKDMPAGCAWGIFDKDGEKDTLGTLNFLTADVIKAAKEEIQHGVHVQLDWTLDCFKTPFFGRKSFERTVRNNTKPGETSCDDVIHINTQSSSQWDGFCHFGHCATNLYYNGVKLEDILAGTPGIPTGIDSWVKNGGIVGRGVLIDFVAYAKRHNIVYSAAERYGISPSVIEEIAKEEGVKFREGDIFIVRTGFTDWYLAASEEERAAANNNGRFIGLESGKDNAAWYWNHKFAAVAGDQPAIEAWPPKNFDEVSLHFYLLAMAGMPLGELWDLRKLAEVCAQHGRYSFFFTSAPLNIPNGIASPPNAIAIL